MRTIWVWLLLGGCGGGDDAPDTGDEADTDTDADTDSDTDTGLVGGCDAADGIEDPAWSIALEVTNPGHWCAASDESRTLEQELALKSRLSIPVGTYHLPDGAGTFPYRLPVCIETATGPLQLGAPGEVESAVVTYYGFDSRSVATRQPIRDAAGAVIGTFELSAFLTTPEGVLPDPLVLDGVNDDEYRAEPLGMMLCNLPPYACASGLSATYQACAPVGFDEQHHLLVFDGGDVDLRLDIGASPASTEPAAFVRATGTLDGVAFDVDDYFRLVYNPTHHHFTRSFAVLFDAPIGGACGIAVRDLGGLPEPTVIERVDCDLSVIDTRPLSSSVRVP